jgi:hypothetical protein
MHMNVSFEHCCKVWNNDQSKTLQTNYTDVSNGFNTFLRFIQFNNMLGHPTLGPVLHLTLTAFEIIYS